MTSFSAAPAALRSCLAAVSLFGCAFVLFCGIAVFRGKKGRLPLWGVSLAALLLLCAVQIGLDDRDLPDAARWIDAWPWLCHLAIQTAAIGACALTAYREYRKRDSSFTSATVREAFDELPCGVCIARGDGLPLLTNRAMAALAFTLTGRSLENERDFREALENHPGRISFPGSPSVRLPDGRVWSFSCTQSSLVCLYAAEMTRVYELSRELRRENERLEQQLKKTDRLLAGLTRVRQEEEILAARMRIHDRLGSVLLTTSEHLRGRGPTAAECVKLWRETVDGLRASFFTAQETTDAAAEIADIAADCGCRVEIRGNFPRDNALLLAVLREGTLNAIRHAHAAAVNVTIFETQTEYLLTLRDDGPTVDSVAEGGGLTSLRRKLESAGGSLTVSCGGGGVKLCAAVRKETES
jgi:signal transduction histidine kinase